MIIDVQIEDTGNFEVDYQAFIDEVNKIQESNEEK